MPRTLLASSTEYTPAAKDDRPGVMELVAPVPPPKTELGRYRLLSPNAGVRVSPFALGGASLGNQWTGWSGRGMDYEESSKYLDVFYEAGGNFIDVAGCYQDEQSEMILGEWMENRGIRDEIIVATKYTSYTLARKEGPFEGIAINYAGNSKKNIHLSVESSLKKLRTSYIDVFYLHFWDYTTSIPELMQSLNDLVKSRKVLYLGISDTPAWIVARANDYAIQHGLAQFVIYQGMWNVGLRDMEREIIPMCRAYGMSVAPFGVMGFGKFKSPDEMKDQAKWRGGAPPSEAELKVSQALHEVAEELGGGVKAASVAIAWARHMVADVFPVIGGTNIEHLKANIEALKIKLTEAQVEKLNNATPFDLGFPTSLFGRDPHYLPGGKPEPHAIHVRQAGEIQYTKYP